MQNDVTYLAILLGLFVLMFLLVAACERIVGKDEEAVEEQGDTGSGPGVDDVVEVAA